ncbi:MAG: pyridoxal phosphate-dependent aminotransferase [Armatimonadota bacterium]
MTPLSRRAQACAPSPTLAITAKANQMKADGINVVAFGAGEPDFDTPDHIKAAAIDALAKGFTKYTPSAGIPALKNAIINKLQRDSGLTYSAAEVIVSCGGKHSLYNIFQVLVDDGDEVIIPAPYWVSYPEQVKLAGGVPVIVQASDDDNFVPTLEAIEAAITERTKVIVINSPSNPTGAKWPVSRIREVAELAVSKGIYIISDEIYEKLVYDGEFVSVASLSPEIAKLTLTCNGMSKAYSMTGWRLGYVAGDKTLVAAMGRIQDQVTSNPTSIAQYAGVAALDGPQEFLEEWRAAFMARRDVIVAGLNAIPGFKCRMPQGAFYVFPNISGLYGKKTPGGKELTSGDDVADYLLESKGVAVVPGSGFGTPDFVRFSYATNMDAINEGVRRIREAVDALVD